MPPCRLLFQIAALLLLVASARGDADGPADLVVRNAKVLTVDAKSSTAEAVAIRGGVFVFVGSDADVKKLIGDKTRVIDAQGKTVIPGLIETHVHAVGAAKGEVLQPFVLRQPQIDHHHVRCGAGHFLHPARHLPNLNILGCADFTALDFDVFTRPGAAEQGESAPALQIAQRGLLIVAIVDRACEQTSFAGTARAVAATIGKIESLAQSRGQYSFVGLDVESVSAGLNGDGEGHAGRFGAWVWVTLRAGAV